MTPIEQTLSNSLFADHSTNAAAAASSKGASSCVAGVNLPKCIPFTKYVSTLKDLHKAIAEDIQKERLNPEEAKSFSCRMTAWIDKDLKMVYVPHDWESLEFPRQAEILSLDFEDIHHLQAATQQQREHESKRHLQVVLSDFIYLTRILRIKLNDRAQKAILVKLAKHAKCSTLDQAIAKRQKQELTITDLCKAILGVEDLKIGVSSKILEAMQKLVPLPTGRKPHEIEKIQRALDRFVILATEKVLMSALPSSQLDAIEETVTVALATCLEQTKNSVSPATSLVTATTSEATSSSAAAAATASGGSSGQTSEEEKLKSTISDITKKISVIAKSSEQSSLIPTFLNCFRLLRLVAPQEISASRSPSSSPSISPNVSCTASAATSPMTAPLHQESMAASPITPEENPTEKRPPLTRVNTLPHSAAAAASASFRT